MKSFINSFIILALITLVFVISCKKDHSTSPPPSNVNLKKGLLLYLPFNGNFADSSGNGNPAAGINGAAFGADAGGNGTSAFAPTGKGERVIVTNNGSIKFDTAFTASFNVKISDQSNQIFLALAEFDNAHGLTFDCGLNVPGNEQFEFGVGDAINDCDKPVEQQPYNLADSTGARMTTGIWYNIICVYHRGTISSYINGKLVSTKAGGGTQALNCPNGQFIVGGWWKNDPTSLNGAIDEVRFYNRLLNNDEIAELSKAFKTL